MQSDVFLTTKELAIRWRTLEQSIRRARSRGGGPRYIRMGTPPRGRVLYLLKDVEEWERARAAHSPAEEFERERTGRPPAPPVLGASRDRTARKPR